MMVLAFYIASADRIKYIFWAGLCNPELTQPDSSATLKIAGISPEKCRTNVIHAKRFRPLA
jgi:hypothetical protein